MANSGEPSSSLSFPSSSHLSNGSLGHNLSSNEGLPSLEVISLTKLSSSLEQLLLDSGRDYSDAEIIVEGVPVGVHRCILASRSEFFRELFKKENGCSEKGGKPGKPKYKMKDVLPYGDIGHEAFLVYLSYVYTGKLKPSPMEVSTCVHNICAHDSCRPAIDFSVELMYAASVFQMLDLVSVFQRRLLNFVGKAQAEDVIPILMVASHCQLSELLTHCVERVARSDLDSICIDKELPDEVAEKIKLLRSDSQPASELSTPPVDPLHEKRIRRIHKALDSDDVELVKLLLSESNITLDEAYALHYAAAYCDSKVVTEVLALGMADINLRNPRGYTVLHIAVMRMEPSIVVLLLSKGAHASELTADGQSAVSICRRLTRPKDYHAKTVQGKETNKDRLCIDVLERQMWRNPIAGDASVSVETVADDVHMKLLYLENRVAFARLFFPSEAKLAMAVAQSDTTSEFAGITPSKGSSRNLMEVDLNETPIGQKKRLHSRLDNLMKTVKMGRRYFPHCSEVLDKFMEDDLPDLFFLETGTPDEQKIKRMRFMELKDEVHKAFTKDKELDISGLTSSSSSSSPKKFGVNHKTRKLDRYANRVQQDSKAISASELQENGVCSQL